jgi:hypothetical protein
MMLHRRTNARPKVAKVRFVAAVRAESTKILPIFAARACDFRRAGCGRKQPARTLASAPGKTARTTKLVPGDAIGATLHAALDKFGRRVVVGHVTAELPVRHGIDQIGRRTVAARRCRHAQDWTNRGVTAEQQGCGKQHEEKRRRDDGAERCRAIFRAGPISVAGARIDDGRAVGEPCRRFRAWSFGHRLDLSVTDMVPPGTGIGATKTRQPLHPG